MKFFMFHLMPWPYLPDDFEQHHKSAWVTCPNTYYDPSRGTTVYNNYLIGSMTHELELKSMNLFATEVMPQVRAEVDRSLSYRVGATERAAHQMQA